eukprot:gene25567-40492_t
MNEIGLRRCNGSAGRFNHLRNQPQALRLALCAHAIVEAEARGGFAYDWVVRVRPDFRYRRRLPHVAAVYAAHFPKWEGRKGARTASPNGVLVFDDQMAIAPRGAGVRFLLAAPAAYQLCAGAEEWAAACAGLREWRTGGPASPERLRRIEKALRTATAAAVGCCPPSPLVEMVAGGSVAAPLTALTQLQLIVLVGAQPCAPREVRDVASRPTTRSAGDDEAHLWQSVAMLVFAAAAHAAAAGGVWAAWQASRGYTLRDALET